MVGVPTGAIRRMGIIARFNASLSPPGIQSGAASLAVVLLLSVLSLALGLYSAQVSRTELKMAVDDTLDKQALDVATAGLAVASRLIVTHGVPDDELASSGVGNAGSGLAGVGAVQTLDGIGYRFAAFGGGAGDGYYVRVVDNHDETSGTDNPQSDVDQTIDIISVGVVGTARRIVQGSLLRVPKKWGIYAYHDVNLSGLGTLRGWHSTATNAINVGAGRDMVLGGQTVIRGSVEVAGNLTMTGLSTARNLTVGGNIDLGGGGVNTVNGGGNLTMSGLAHAGNTTVAGNIAMSGQAYTGALNGGGTLDMIQAAYAGNTVVDGDVHMQGLNYLGTLDTGGSLSMTGSSYTKSVQVNGDIALTSSAKIKGNAALNGTVTADNPPYAEVTGSTTSPAFPATPLTPDLTFADPPPIQPVSACGPPYSDGTGITITDRFTVRGGYDPVTGDLSGKSYDVITLDPGEYCIHDFTLSSLAQLKVTGPTVINMTGSWSMSGLAATAANLPANLVINVYGGGAVDLGSLTAAYMVVNAPTSVVTVSGGGALFGAVVADTINVSGDGDIYQDLSLSLNGGSVSSLLSNWRQVQ